MTEIKEAPKTKAGNGQSQIKETARQTPTEMQKLEARWTDFTRRFAEEMDRAFADFGHE
jgi:hypothetical protein